MLKEILVYLRRKNKLSQYELAERLGFSRGKLANYEQGSRQPDYETIIKIAEYFDVTVDYLLGKDGDQRLDKKTKELVNEKEAIMKKIATEFPDIDLMFKDMENMTAEDFQDVYDYIKFKMSQKGE